MSAQEWYGPHVTPYASVADYRTAPPKGMTNPPQNPKVRAKLLAELEEYGVQLEVESWPPPMPDLKASGYVFGQPAEPLDCRSPACKRASGLAQKHMSWIRDGDTGHIANRLADQLVPFTQRPESRSDSRGESRPASRPSSGKAGSMVGSKSEPALGAKQKDGSKGSKNASKQVQRPVSNQKGKPVQASGTASQKDAAAKDSSAQGSKQDSAGTGEAGKQKASRVANDTELGNSLIGLRSQGRLHQASCVDRFRFGADLKAAGGMVLKGAGATPVAPGMWASDGSELIKFHNKAIRLVNPSHLPLKPLEKHKKKKKKVDEDELPTGEKYQLYEADKSYRAIRRLRRTFYPDSFQQEKTKKEHVIAETQGLMASLRP